MTITQSVRPSNRSSVRLPLSIVRRTVREADCLYPTVQPSDRPTHHLAVRPTDPPTAQPSDRLTDIGPLQRPTWREIITTSHLPTVQPSERPSDRPDFPTRLASRPFDRSTVLPPNHPTFHLTAIDRSSVRLPFRSPHRPSDRPTVCPTAREANSPTIQPTVRPSSTPTRRPPNRPIVRVRPPEHLTISDHPPL